MPLLTSLKPLALPAIICQVALLSLLIVGCDPNNSSQAAVPHPPGANQVLYYPVLQSTTFTLDPALANDADSIRVVDTLFTGLVALDDQLHVHSQLADYWEQSDDGLTWTFHLKPSLFFSDGKPLTSYDVAYSIDRALQPGTKSPTALGFLGSLKDADQLTEGQINTLINDSIQTPDDNTIQFITSKP